jgi:uncharacterized phage protein gp47/JayE
MILYDKTEEELNAYALEMLGKTNISNDKPGARARIILEIENKVLRSYYSALDFNVTMAFVSKAKDAFLDEIGALLNCTRVEGEDEENYRYRITQQVYVAEGCNQTAIRLAALSVENVVDVVLTPYTFGTGSFSVHVITDSLSTLPDTVRKVQEEMDKVQAFGVKGTAVAPKTLSVGCGLILSFAIGVSDKTKRSIASDTKRAIKSYINSLSMGEELVMSSIIQIARDAGKNKVKDAVISRMEVDKQPILLNNYIPYWDEKLYVSTDDDITIV